MTNKEQIVIDGVNVGGCKYLNTFSDCDGYHYYCDLADDIKNEYCEHYKDCYYKQLTRKTQECEELKAYAQAQENQRETYYKEYLKLSQECEKLKSELHLYKTWYRAKHGDIKEYLSRYYKALKEIEKVCLEDTYTLADGTQIRYDSLDDILDIINKAKGEE